MSVSTFSTISRRSWLGWILLASFCVFQFTLQGSVGIFADSLKGSLGLDAKELSLLSSSFYYSYIMMQIPVGFIFDRYPVRWISTIALTLVAASLLCFAFAPNLILACVARVFMGVACSFGFVGLLVAMGKWFPASIFALIVAISECVELLGVAGLNSLLSLLVTEYDWRFATKICAAIAMVIALGIFICIPREKISGEQKESRKALWDSLKTVLSYKEVWYGGFFSFTVFSVVTVFAGLWGIPFLMSAANIDLVGATSLISMIYIGGAFSSPVLGWLTGTFRLSSIMIPSAAFSGLLMVAIIYGASNVSLITLYALIFVLGFASSVYQFPFAIVNKVLPSEVKGVAMGVTNILCMLNGPVLQPIIAFLLARSVSTSEEYTFESFQNGLLIIPVCSLIAVFLGFRLRKLGA